MKAYDSYLRAVSKLSFWLPLVAKCRIPYISAIFSDEFTHAAMYVASYDNEANGDLAQAIIDIQHIMFRQMFQEGPQIIRWEEGVSINVKKAISKGKWKHGEHFTAINLRDKRILNRVATVFTRLCVRPYVRPMVVDNYPVEFRVYYDQDGLVAVSNLYPQRPLEPDYNSALHQMIRYCEKLWNVNVWKFGFAVDFMLTERGQVIFVDGNPPCTGDKKRPGSNPLCCDTKSSDIFFYRRRFKQL